MSSCGRTKTTINTMSYLHIKELRGKIFLFRPIIEIIYFATKYYCDQRCHKPFINFILILLLII